MNKFENPEIEVILFSTDINSTDPISASDANSDEDNV